MGAFAHEVVQLGAAIVKRAAPEQAGLFAGLNPAKYSASDPFPLWVIQVVIIIGMTQLLSLLLSRIRQPRVIAEVIGGVILGPSIMGRIPGFRANIFPTDSLPILTLTSTVGLVLFLFLVGVEVDVGIVKRNWRAAGAISIAGLVVPLGLGAALGVPLYHQFVDSSVHFGYFILFTAVAIGITAFPVLCRILTELKLLDTTVGITVLSAGVGNDIVGWILLALTVALVNASNGLNALWILLTSVGYVLFLLFPVKWGYAWLAHRTGSFEKGGPTTLMMTVTLFVILTSAFFTDVIGVHPIFGGFVAGLIVPKKNGYAISLVEKMEDLVSILLLPIYFALSGLKTNLGLLNDGVTWGYVILICVFAFVSKFVSCGLTAKLAGFNLRESGAIGALMSCKGLVELIVLNVGLQAGVLDTRVFSMFVVHALVLTFMTTPLTILFYPAKLRVHPATATGLEDGSSRDNDDNLKTRFSVVLDKIEHLPAVMTIMQLLQGSSAISSGTELSPASQRTSVDIKASDGHDFPHVSHNPVGLSKTVSVNALRLVELDQRTSAVLRSQDSETLIQNDPVVSVFRTYGQLNRIPVSCALSVVSRDDYSVSVATHARDSGSEMVIIPWQGSFARPIEGLEHNQASVIYSNFVRSVFAQTPADVALFLDNGISANISSTKQHIVLPFFGGPDDRLALSLVVQLCLSPNATATVIRMNVSTSDALAPVDTIEETKAYHTIGLPDTVYGRADTQTRLQSTTADSLIWDHYTSSSGPFAAGVPAALSRVRFTTETSTRPLRAVVDRVASIVKVSAPLVVVGRSRRMSVETHRAELLQLLAEHNPNVGSDVSKTLGDVAAALIVAGSKASLLVVQAASSV
ncbi:cation/H+ exchanger [Punctularia strigosozonata HHB-11173 SS5]|uniref:cation/H+ exchanger n=1 Tax=Punctularia strigosozonata (strain HHB-11173) TaxID=741275 RepID=UPI0004417CE9|nr:cation/H+ exchanger [Punctularia strigosozonata HHB-11173 SS5]EIN10840.1 cation/H+ exchanger [Punctularia strigosozonata HHB-11173 SS5]